MSSKRKELKRIRNEVHPYIRFTVDYNNKKMPLNSLPLDVNLTINIKNIYGVDEVSQLLGMETTVQMNWIDERITLLDVAKEHINLDRITLPPDVSSTCSHKRFCSGINVYFVVSQNLNFNTNVDVFLRKPNTFGYQTFI